MAESSNSSTSTTGASSTSTSNSSTSTTGTNSTSTSNSSTSNSSTSNSSTSNGSQSSNGSSSTGKGSGNNGVGPGLSFGAGIGGINGPSTGLPGSTPGIGLPGLTPGFTGFASSNFGQGWGNGNTNSSNNANYMTVDEVYGKENGKSNQSIVENQGDYEASSNEKSNVETSTFGKQDEISVTPLSVTEDKGLVNNDAIQSVEGLDFQQKDKSNQEVMEAKKSRDDAEAEDNANGMRDQLKSVAEKDAEEEVGEDFRVGDRDEDLAKAQAEVDRLANEKTKYKDEQKKNADQLEIFGRKAVEKQQAIEQEDADYQAKKTNADQLEAIGQKINSFEQRYQEVANKDPNNIFNRPSMQKALREISSDLNLFKIQLGVDATVAVPNAYQAKEALKEFQTWEGDFAKEYFDGLKDFSPNSITAYKAGIVKQHLQNSQQLTEEVETLAQEVSTLKNRQKELQALITDNEKKSIEVNEAYNKLKTESFVETAAPASKAEEAVTTEAPSYKANIEAARNEINNSKDLTDEQKSEADTVLGNVETAADAMNEAANNLAKNPNDINAVKQYVEETAKYNKALKDAKGKKTLKNTDFNKTFTKAVAAANDFMVTREDGTQQNYAEFAAEMAVKSPELAKGLYEAKAKNYEENGHKVLAAIETAKSKMVMTWLGSKFTFADNQVRSQFNQMAKTDMRATYAAYNNVLNNETGKYSEAEKAEAFDAIQQANSLMTASAALQASTGFLSGIGDGTSDGAYGTTDPGKLNAAQKALNTASNFAKITLGLGVTPGANKAYQNMYYIAGAKVNESGLFSKDFDGDGFALCQEYGNNAAVGMIAGAGELATSVALMFNPATSKLGINLAIDAVQTFLDGLYGVQKEVNKSIKYSSEVLSYFNEAKNIAAETGNKEAIGTMDSAIKQIEDFQLKSDEVGNLDNWLEGSGSNTADNGKFNQALSYDEWLKLIEADPVMQEYAKSLNR